ncbi:MAG: hypothetical protein JW909_11580 [Planctomycetes bacterium]|nr:hypothetical protein [Planctomycetota bacterium]
MFDATECFTLKERYRFFHHSRLAAAWFMANQNTPEHPWGNIHDSADLGRFVYEYRLPGFAARGDGVWGQATAVMGLLALHKRTGDARYLNSALLAGDYLMTLQFLDPRVPSSVGAFREHSPLTPWSYPRDAATGVFGLLALYKYTGNEEYLYRSRLFADWWLAYGTDSDNWPYVSFDISKGRGTNVRHAASGEDDTPVEFVKGDWQAGAGLFLFYLWKLTGETRYVDEGLRPMLDRAIEFYARNPVSDVVEGFHGHVEVSYGNDDFALTALLAGYLAFDDRRYLDAAAGRIVSTTSIMDADGSFPSYGGTFVCGINMANLHEMNSSLNLGLDIGPVQDSIRKNALFGLTLQEQTNTDYRLFGGCYGQNDFGVARDWIHQRSTSYSIAYYMRLEGKTDVPYFHCLHW